MLIGEAKEASLDSWSFKDWGLSLCAKTGDWIRLILEEAHCSRYSIHPGVTKMYCDLRQHYWWGDIR